MNRRNIIVVAAGAALGALYLFADDGPVAASGNVVVKSDADGDVVEHDLLEGGDTPAPDRVGGDITELRAVHGVRQVRITMELDELSDDTDEAVHAFAVRAGSGRQLLLTGYDYGDTSDWAVLGADGQSRGCRGWRHVIDRQDDQVRVTVPRRCLGEPRRIKVGAGELSYSYADDGEVTSVYADDALLEGESEATYDDIHGRLELTEWIEQD